MRLGMSLLFLADILRISYTGRSGFSTVPLLLVLSRLGVGLPLASLKILLILESWRIFIIAVSI